MSAAPLLVFNLVLSGFLALAVPPEDREWSDKSGHYKFKAELVAWNDSKAVLQHQDKQLVTVNLDDLSAADREYIKSVPVKTGSVREMNVWQLQDGFKFKGQFLQFDSSTLEVHADNDALYVDNRKFDNLPPVYQDVVLHIASHFVGQDFADAQQLIAWLKGQPDSSKEFQCNGVLMQTENGDRYNIPIFLFADADEAVLNTGWNRWQNARNREERETESLILQAQDRTRQDPVTPDNAGDLPPVRPDPPVRPEPPVGDGSAGSRLVDDLGNALDGGVSQQLSQIKRIGQMQLNLQAYDAGLFSLWKVQLLPPWGSNARWRWVVVPARNSLQATEEARQRAPAGWRTGAVARVRREY